MEHIAEEFVTDNGYTIKIIADEDAQAPDEWGDNNVILVTTRNRYFERLHEKQDCGELAEDKDFGKRYWAFPVFAYIHSGVALSLGRGGQFSDAWDSGRIGTLYLAKSEWRLSKSAEKYARGHIEEWNQYLSGDVWGYVIEQPNGDHVDSCWGFYGLEYCKKEALSCVPAEPATNAEECDELEETLP